MKSMSIAAAKSSFADCVKRAEHGEPVVITRYGRPVAALVSVEAFEAQSALGGRGPRGTLLDLVELEGMGELTEELDRIVERRGPTRDVPELE